MDLTAISFEQAVVDLDFSNTRILELSCRLQRATQELARLRTELREAQAAIGGGAHGEQPAVSVHERELIHESPMRRSGAGARRNLSDQIKNLFVQKGIAFRQKNTLAFHIDWICGKSPAVGGVTLVSKREHRLLSISGWAVPSNAGRPFDWIGVELQGALGSVFKKVPVQGRPDVGIHFSNPAFSAAGFSIEIALNELATGSYSVDIVGGAEGVSARASAGSIEIS